MKILLKTILLAALLPAAAGAQTAQHAPENWTGVMNQILQNNPTVKALSARETAARRLNTADLRLPDPEAEVAYLIGSPRGVPNRTNVAVSQSLDWGVLTGRARRLAEAGNDVAAAAARQGVQAVLAEADQTLVSLVHANRLCAELERREAVAREVLRLYEEKLERGDVNRLEVNKVKLNASVSRAELERARSERQTLLQALQRLNGGVAVTLADTLYPYAADRMPALADLESAVAGCSPVAAAEAAVRQGEAEVKAARAQGWPTLNVGFEGEYIRQNNYSGLSLGFSLPLWGNTRRKVKAAQAEALARRLEVDDVRQTQAAQLAQQYAAAQALTRTAGELRADLDAAGNDRLLRRSLEEGQISLLDYLLELSFYYEARTAWLEAERDAQLAVSQVRGLLY